MLPETNESKSNLDRLRQSSSSAGEKAPTSPATITTSPGTLGEPSSSTSAAAAAAPLATKVNNHSHQHNYQNNVMQSKTSYSAGKQQMAATALHQHYLNYFNSNIPKEETKSQQRTRSAHSAAQDLASQMNHSNGNQRSNHNTNNSQPMTSGNSNYIYHTPAQMHGHHAHVNLMSRSAPKDESHVTQRIQQLHHQQHHNHHHHHYQQQQQTSHQQQHPPHTQPANMKSRSHSTGALCNGAPQQQQPQHQSAFRSAIHNIAHTHEAQQQQQLQQDRDSEETTTTTIKEELENDLQGCKTSELEAISSLERNLPIELSFLIRQQAHCMARMNYLDRQIRELKDAAQCQQQVDSNQVSSSSIHTPGQQQMNRPASNIVNLATTTTMPHAKHGNFILSDDSGGEYSRATLSDDDELSSLLDQIAKSVRPERASGNSMISNNYNHLHQQQQQQQQQQRLATNCGTLMSTKQQPQQPYAIINANQLHHQQAVPIFVMGSPIAVAHPSSISSNILPGVHFQPEPRYNQYYEDLCYGNTLNAGLASSMISTPTMAMHRHPPSHHHQQQQQQQQQSGQRAQQFDNSISVIEQLVSQREKRQIMSQLKSADNWLKMRSGNLQDSSIRTAMGGKQQQQQQQQQQHQQVSLGRQMSGETQAQELEEQPSDSKR